MMAATFASAARHASSLVRPLAEIFRAPAGRPGPMVCWQVGLALLFYIAPAVSAAPTSPATAVTDADARDVRAVVEAQLQAFAAGDAERAFSYASPAIRSQFGDATSFMAMVRAGYPMVVQPTRLAFFQAQGGAGQVLQTVQMQDRAGRLWRASYLLERGPAGWRISGCTVVPDDGKSNT